MDSTVALDRGATKKRISEHFDLMSAECGTMLVNRHDIPQGGNLPFAMDEIELLSQFVRGVSIDIGANIGTHTVNYSKKSDVVYSIEAQPTTFLNLCANILLNCCTNVLPLNVAMGSQDGETVISRIDPTKEHSSQGYRVGTIGAKIPIRRLDTLDITPVDFIKIDVEGFEYDVVKGAVETLKRENPVVYIECHMERTGAKVIDLMSSLGYLHHLLIAQQYIEFDDYATKGYIFYRENKITWIEP